MDCWREHFNQLRVGEKHKTTRELGHFMLIFSISDACYSNFSFVYLRKQVHFGLNKSFPLVRVAT